MSFIATVAYELDPLTPPDARKLLRAELVGRRYQDRLGAKVMPANVVWIKRTAEPGETVEDLRAKCEQELRDAVTAVAATGRVCRLVRGWVQVSGAGTFGLIEPSPETPAREKV